MSTLINTDLSVGMNVRPLFWWTFVWRMRTSKCAALKNTSRSMRFGTQPRSHRFSWDQVWLQHKNKSGCPGRRSWTSWCLFLYFTWLEGLFCACNNQLLFLIGCWGTSIVGSQMKYQPRSKFTIRGSDSIGSFKMIMKPDTWWIFGQKKSLATRPRIRTRPLYCWEGQIRPRILKSCVWARAFRFYSAYTPERVCLVLTRILALPPNAPMNPHTRNSFASLRFFFCLLFCFFFPLLHYSGYPLRLTCTQRLTCTPSEQNQKCFLEEVHTSRPDCDHT